MRFNQPRTPAETRLDEQAERLKEKASHLPSGRERDSLLKKSREFVVAAHLDGWLNSPGLQAPRSAE